MSILATTIEYSGGQIANLTKADKTAEGITDDKEPDSPSQVAQIGAGSTDARPVANVLFASKVRIPAEIMAAGDFYDMTQAYTRTNEIYSMTREDYYRQAAAAVQTRKNRLALKQELVSNCIRLSEEPKKILEEMASA